MIIEGVKWDRDRFLEQHETYESVTFTGGNLLHEVALLRQDFKKEESDDDKVVLLQDDVYAAYLPSEFGGKTRLHLKYVSYIEIDGKEYRNRDVLDAYSQGEKYSFSVYDLEGKEKCYGKICFYYATQVSTLYVDTVSGSMDKINESERHEYSETAMFYAVEADGTMNMKVKCSLKGRGNSTWTQEGKKPYSLETDKAESIYGMKRRRSGVCWQIGSIKANYVTGWLLTLHKK